LLEVAFSTRTANAFSELIILCQRENITFNAKTNNQRKANVIKENSPDKRTIIPEQKAFQDGTGAPVEQPLPDSPDHIFYKRNLVTMCKVQNFQISTIQKYQHRPSLEVNI